MELAPNPRYSGGSKSSRRLIYISYASAKTWREMTQLPRETQKDGDMQTN